MRVLLSVILITLFLVGCTLPLAVVTPPVYYAGNPTENMELYFGARGGIPSDNIGWYATPFLGIGGEAKIIKADVVTWAGYYTDPYMKRIPLHVACNLSIAPNLSEQIKLEIGLTAGACKEKQEYKQDTLLPESFPVATAALFTGLTVKNQNRLFGIRAYLIGVGTGIVFSYRVSNITIWGGTQVLPLLLNSPNFTAGMSFNIPIATPKKNK